MSIFDDDLETPVLSLENNVSEIPLDLFTDDSYVDSDEIEIEGEDTSEIEVNVDIGSGLFSSEVSVEGLFEFAKAKNAYQEQAENAQYSRALNKETDEEIEQRHADKEAKEQEKQAKKEERKENRKQALRDLGSDLVEAAKATGKGVKEVARIAYNLATGSSK
jgi:hypothetical protein|nr:MAG TPA: hypothetical protein [Caudoviricetes sp.]